MRARPAASTGRSGLALLLTCCLLFAQWLGLQHAVAHAGGLEAGRAGAEAKAHAPASLHNASTSCSALDHACLGASAPTAAFVPSTPPTARILPPPLAGGWHPTFHPYVSPRAPPHA